MVFPTSKSAPVRVFPRTAVDSCHASNGSSDDARITPFAGTVTTVGAAAGDLVKLGATLFVVEQEAGA